MGTVENQENREAVEAFKRARVAIRRYANLAGKPLDEAVTEFTASLDCEGHESLDGAHMGETVHCDGTCRF